MSKDRAKGFLTVSTEHLSGDGCDGHGDTDEAVLEYTEPDNLPLLAHLPLLASRTHVEPR